MPINHSNHPTFNIKLLHALLLTAKHHGIGQNRSLAHSDIDPDALHIPGRRYPTSIFSALLSHLTTLSKNPNFITLAAETTQPRMLGSIGFVMTTATTLLDTYQMLSDYFSLIFDGITLKISHEQQNCILSLQNHENDAMVNEFFIGCLLSWPRWLIGRTLPAQAIHYTCGERTAKNQQIRLANQVKFNQPRHQIIFQNHYMNLKCAEANPEMHQLHCHFADSLLLKSVHKKALIVQTKYQIRKLILESKASGNPGVRRSQIAASLNMSLRTFQRRLNSLQSNYQAIFDSVRHEICLQLMGQMDTNLSEIAYKLGFSNLSSFQKAFKRWMKTSPSEYRKQIWVAQSLQNPVASTPPVRAWYLTLGDSELHSTITEKLQNLSHFTQQILLVAALTQKISQKPTSIAQLVKITGHSIARLSIYLWPATQELLLETVDNLDSKSASLNFTPAAVINSIILFAFGQQLSEHHYAIGLYHQRSPDKALCLAHFRLCTPQFLKVDQQRQIVNVCQMAITNTSHFNSHDLDQCYTLLINCQRIYERDSSNINRFYIEQLAIWIELSMFDQAQQRILYLQTQPLTFKQRISLAIIASQRLVELKKPEQALLLLTDTAAQYCGIKDASNLESNVLIDISFQLEAIAKYFNDQPEYFIQPVTNKRMSNSLLNQLRLLKKSSVFVNKPIIHCARRGQ